jgi:hypothetical protein
MQKEDCMNRLDENTPVPEWHWQVLEERLAAYRADPGSARPWQEVRAEISRKLNDHRRNQSPEGA